MAGYPKDFMSAFRQKCIGYERPIDAFAAIPHSIGFEVTQASGLDFIYFNAGDAQIGHELRGPIGAFDIDSVRELVRLPGHTRASIAGVLDAGIADVLVPRVSTAARAKAAVIATRYRSVGEHGVGPGPTAGYSYRFRDDLESANESLVLAIKIETARGLVSGDEIVAVEGVEVIFMGPGDLSVSLDVIGPKGAKTLDAAILKIAEAARATGEADGIFLTSPEVVDKSSKWASASIYWRATRCLSAQAWRAAQRPHATNNVSSWE
ncbi:aldolase/citrate lyase family protein [Rhizobium populisoli]|uniref:aldolase/citrate lyase family protein n=1 Tax=Rhizobium populisoli TaxID=2859785 RepID=UPI001FEBA8CE|nr:aldolase/citrate lyase family protein [Rhizobium populisoli]